MIQSNTAVAIAPNLLFRYGFAVHSGTQEPTGRSSFVALDPICSLPHLDSMILGQLCEFDPVAICFAAAQLTSAEAGTRSTKYVGICPMSSSPDPISDAAIHESSETAILVRPL
jgi:hypothetical protein